MGECVEGGAPMTRIVTELQPLYDVTALQPGYSLHRDTQEGSPGLGGHVSTYGCLPYTTPSTDHERITEAEDCTPE